jgi:hypothetical protein
VILKGNARSGAANLARHLANHRDNDRVELADVRGVAPQELSAALMDMEALASGTKCEKHLYSLSINPSRPLDRAEYAIAIERIEQRLGLTDHARVVVYHHKKSAASGESREHCHVVWSRIDDRTMTAAQLSFDRMTLRTMARELARDFGLELPRGLAEDRGRDRFVDRFNEKTYADQAQEKRSALSADERKATITAAFRSSDSGHAFANALEEKGFYLAQGDRRAFVVIDMAGEVHSLRRQIEGTKAKDIAAKLAPLEPSTLPTVDQAKALVAQRQRAQADRGMAYGATVDDLIAQKKRHDDLQRSHEAELKAIRARFEKLRETAEQQQADAIKIKKKKLRDFYIPQWLDLYQRQDGARRGVDKARKTLVGRVKYYLDGGVRLNLSAKGKGHLRSAFNWLARGEVDVEARLVRRQAIARRILSRKQTKDHRTVERAIKNEFRPHFDQLTDHERTQLQTRKAEQRLELLKSERLIQSARERVEARKPDKAREDLAKHQKKVNDQIQKTERTEKGRDRDWMRGGLSKASFQEKQRQTASERKERERGRDERGGRPGPSGGRGPR